MGGVKVARGTNSIIFADLGGAAPELSLVLRVCACLQTRRAAYEPGTPGRFRGKAGRGVEEWTWMSKLWAKFDAEGTAPSQDEVDAMHAARERWRERDEYERLRAKFGDTPRAEEFP